MKKLIKKFKKLFLIVLCVLVALCIFQWYEQSQNRCSITKTTFTENSYENTLAHLTTHICKHTH